MTVDANPGISFDQAREGLSKIASARRQARRDLQDSLERKADRERAYRKRLATEFAKQRDAGKSVVEAETHAKGAAADIAWRRDMADAVAKAAAHRIAELEGERSSLRMLADWTREES